HGGRTAVQRGIGRGLSFTVTRPIKRKSGPAAGTQTSDEASDGTSDEASRASAVRAAASAIVRAAAPAAPLTRGAAC
ncbi:histidine kinase, partial [Burkholderia thailandensis]|nr:histidine kinase [Burkholderia thailandensis]